MINELKNIIIKGSEGKPILVDVCYNANKIAKPIIIFSHGFKGFKDWGHFNKVAKIFAQNDFVFVKFNFSHNGTTIENPVEFNDLETFGNNNYLKELNDLELIINWVKKFQEINIEIDESKIFLLGHSRGGGISILKASQNSSISKITTWAAVSDIVHRNNNKTIETWKSKGVVYTLNGRTKQQMPLYLQFYNCIKENESLLDICKAAKSLTIPFLIIHGTTDEAVNMSDAIELHKANSSSELIMLEGAGHTFEVKHPFTDKDLPFNAKKAIEITIDFFRK